MRAENLTLLTDLYELTMMKGYYKNPVDKIVVFDVFYRKNPCDGAYAISAGLEQVMSGYVGATADFETLAPAVPSED